jgi:FkbM family methyltransferase
MLRAKQIVVCLGGEMRQKVKSVTPEFVLTVYRTLRNKRRIVLRNVHDRRGSNAIEALILNRFPDLGTAKHRGMVLDLGANVGNFSQACVNLGFTVIAVEPHPEALSYLQSRMKNEKSVQILAAGVSDVPGKSTLYTHPDHKNDPLMTSISASIIGEKFQAKGMSFDINLISLDSLFEKTPLFDLVKIDIEGAEMLLVDSIIKNASGIKRLLVETHERFMIETTEAKEYQAAMFKLESFIEGNNLKNYWLTDWI